MFKIALDAGHGMNTPGKRCLKALDPNETREWYLNDKIADLVEKKLEAYEGYEVLRVDDATGNVDVSLSKRVQAANAWGADFYLSVHHNAGVAGGSGGGIISIAYTRASPKSLEYQKLIYEELINATGLKGNRIIPCPKQNLQVLRETNMPAVLVECGFMDSSTDVPVILSEEFAEACADGLVLALAEIGKLTEKRENIMECDGTSQKRFDFADIEGHFAEDDINDLVCMGIVNGKTNDRFMPNEPITRGEVAAVARRIIRYITGK